jgi:hypothetical protein
MRTWILRCAVLLVFALLVWQFGPKAWVVLSARLGGAASITVDLDRVGLSPEGRGGSTARVPAWLRDNPALFRAVLEEISPCLKTRVRLDDEVALTRVAGVLNGMSWVSDVRVRPADGGGFRLSLELRRPVLEVVPDGAAVGRVPPVYVTAEGICLSHGEYDLDSGLPRCRMISGSTPGSLPLYILGKRHPDSRVIAAAAVAREWRDEMIPLVPGAPRLVGVDASNLHYRLLADRRTSQVRVALRRSDGGVALFDYGLPPGQPITRVAVADKAAVLSKVLDRHPGLAGVSQADLRFVNMWENWVRPAAAPSTRARGGFGR